MTLLERWDAVGAVLAEVRPEEIRKAIVDAERLRAEVDALTQSRNNAVKEAGKVIIDLRAKLAAALTKD